MWVASAGGYVLRYNSTSEGDSTFFGPGLAGTISVTYELTEVNGPVVVDLPRDCPEGLVAAPMLPDASNVVNEPGLLGYDTASSVTDVVAFYQGRSADLGWTSIGKPTVADSGATMDYTKGDDSVTIMIATGVGGTTVHIVLNMPRE